MSDATNVQDVVADKVEAPVPTETPAVAETAATTASEPTTTETAPIEPASTESKTVEAPSTTEDKAEADIVAAAAKLADSAEKNDAEVAEAKAGEHGHSNGHGRDATRGGRGGRGGYKKQQWRENYKSEFPADEKSEDPVEIRKQVEFYFSDSNLPNDKFLMKLTGGSENNAVPLDTICTFKRMRRFEPRSAVVTALKDSEMLELVNDDTAVKRKNPLETDAQVIEAKNDAAMRRSIYAKGFGQEASHTQRTIEGFFQELDDKVRMIRLRRTDFGKFKGSVFVEFETEEKAKAILEKEEKPKWFEQDLQWMSKKEYCDMKLEEIRAGKVKPQAPHQGSRGGNRGRGGRGRYPNGKSHHGNFRGGRGGKRQRDEDSGSGDRAAKKVDTGASA